MTELLIFISKYIFIVLILIFCLQSKYLISVGRITDGDPDEGSGAAGLQRITIVLFHILAYAVLYFSSDIPLEEYMVTALGGLILVLLMPLLIGLVYNRINGLAINCMYFLMDISLVVLQRLNPELALKQMICFFIGSGAIVIIYPILRFTRNLRALKYFYLAAGLVLLLSTIVFGTTVRGATNWIRIGSFSFQPAEIVKILFVFYFASVFSKETSFKERCIQMGIGFVFVALLVVQRDLGSALIFFMTLLIMMFISTGSFLFTLGSIAAASAGAVGAYFIFGHIRVRVEAWLDPWSDISHSGYQIAQSLFAIGSGGIWGSGLGKGYASVIPIVENDFIFSAVCEELGVVFAIFMLFIYMTLFYCGVRSALNTRDRFKAVLAAGLTGLLSFQTFLIVGGVTKFIPLTGVTLPFVSSGGTSVVISTIIVGLLLWIYVPKSERSHIKEEPEDSIELITPSRRHRVNIPDEAPLRRRVRRLDEDE